MIRPPKMPVLLLSYVPYSIRPFFFFFFFTFIYFLLCWVFIALLGLSLAVVSRGSSLVVGVSLRWLILSGAQALGTWASVVATHRLSSSGPRA